MTNFPCNSDNLLKPNYPRKASFSLKSCCLEQEGVKIQNESYRAAYSYVLSIVLMVVMMVRTFQSVTETRVSDLCH